MESLSLAAEIATLKLEVYTAEGDVKALQDRMEEDLDNEGEEAAAMELWKAQKYVREKKRPLKPLIEEYELHSNPSLIEASPRGISSSRPSNQPKQHIVVDSEEEADPRNSRQVRTKLSPYTGKGDIYLYLQRFADYIRENRIKTRSLDTRLCSYISDDEAYRNVKAMRFSEAERAALTLFIAAVKRGLSPAIDRKINLASLGDIRQTAEETVDKFFFRIYDAVSKIYDSHSAIDTAVEASFLQGLRTEIRTEVLKFDTQISDLKSLKDMARKMEKLCSKPLQFILYSQHPVSLISSHPRFPLPPIRTV